jgi:hypothetical protein
LQQLALLGKSSAIRIVVDVDMAPAFKEHPDQNLNSLRSCMELIYPGLLRLRNNGRKVTEQLGYREEEFSEELSTWMGRLKKEAKVRDRSS